MVIFYDFDGTLTPYSFSQYAIIPACGKSLEDFKAEALEMVQKQNVSILEACFYVFKNLLMSKGYAYKPSVISLGADKTEFNPGALAFLENLHNMGVKQYIVTSGYADYVRHTAAAEFVDAVYGTEILDENINGQSDRILTDKDKIDVIKGVLASYPNDTTVLYLGDGLTDKDAFTYVHSIGGKTLFLGEKDSIYETLNNYGIIDEVFAKDFSEDADVNNYIAKLLKTR